MNKHEKDHLDELKNIDESSVEELAEYYPLLGKSAKQRILEKCLEKTDEAEFREGITVSGTEIYRRPLWSRILGAAAAFVCLAAVAGGAVLLKRNSSLYATHQSSGETSQSALVTTAAKTETVTASTTTTEAVTTTTEAASVFVETSEYIAYITTSETTEVTTTDDDTSTTETTTTDVTTTDDEETQETTETTAEVTEDMLTGSWNAGGGVRVFEFYGDGESGRYSAAETSQTFTYDIRDEVMTFHFSSGEPDILSGNVTYISEDSFLIRWDNGDTETFTRIG